MEAMAIAGLMAVGAALFCMLMVVGLARSLDGTKAQQTEAAREQVSKLIARAASAGGLAGILAAGAPAEEGGETSSQTNKSWGRYLPGLAVAGGLLMLVVGIIAGDG